MKKKENKFPGWVFAVGGILLVLLMVGMWVGGTYNTLVVLDEGVNNAWGKVQTAYQRRADLIPNLVSTVKASAEFEKDLQITVTEARAGISNAQTPAELDAAGQKINAAIDVVFENYPQIRSTENFLDLQVQLEGTENRIKVERDGYNDAVNAYQVRTRRFPANIIASMLGFGAREYFASEPGSDTAPDVGELFE